MHLTKPDGWKPPFPSFAVHRPEFVLPKASVAAAVLALICLNPMGKLLAASNTANHFEDGVAAFNKGDFEAARQAFESARSQGLGSPSLYYNLGATYYRLGRYTAAGEAFEHLLAEGDSTALAHYNLGLIALQEGREHDAKSHFLEVLRSGTPKLVALAQEQLRRIDALPDAVPPRHWSSVISLTAGFDSNPTQLNDDAAESKGDGFLDVYAGAEGYIWGDTKKGIRLQGLLFDRSLPEQSDAQFSVGQAGGYFDWRWGKADTAFGLTVAQTYGREELLETRIRFDLSATAPLGDGLATAELGMVQVDAAEAYQGYSGHQQSLDLSYRRDSDSLTWVLGVELEHNDREDLWIGSEFYALSPLRHRLYARLYRSLGTNWTLSAGLDHRWSQFNLPHRLLEDGALVASTRRDSLIGTTAQLSYSASNEWLLFSRLHHQYNDSTIRRYDFSRVELSLGAEYHF